MPRLGDILTFREDRFFEGAVQLDWFYDLDKSRSAAKAFVFHGPKYFGVGAEDLGIKSSQLVDTCSFTRLIADRLFGFEEHQSPFIMAIAGYGAGKSHLALTLGALFSGHDPETSRQILANLRDADADIGHEIKNSLSKPNLVIALNGMRDFNLNYEVLNAARKSLALHGQDDSPLRALTKAHEIAARFLERHFERLEESFVAAAADRFPNTPASQLFDALRQSLLTTGDAFEVINKVYHEDTGSYIRWDDGLSAADILKRLNQTVVGEKGYFNKILILFDEFGRFIEYASAYPMQAGEAALQQIFEVVQNSDGNIVMVGLIQSDLRSYLARVSHSSNIIRYVSRYEAAEKVHLSSNLETIFAHLIERKDADAFSHYVRVHHERNQNYLQAIHERLLAWVPAASQKSVWREWDRYASIIVEGTYPLHSLTTWMLTTFSEWLQQRSALTFVHDALNRFKDLHVDQFGDLPYVRAIRIIQSDFFQELLAAEREGRQQTDVCQQYESILRKHELRLNDHQKAVLAANVIARIGRFRTQSREDAELLLAECSGLTREDVSASIEFLEHELGVLEFDEHSCTFDFVEDAVGVADFKRLLDRKRKSTSLDLSLVFDGSDIRQTLGISDPQPSTFAERHHIATQEWDFTQEVVWHQDLSDERLQMYVREWRAATSPDTPKGRVVWLYIPERSASNVYDDIYERIAKNGLLETPIVFMLLDDREGQLYNALIDWQVARSLTEEEKRKYERFIPGLLTKTETALRAAFEQLQRERTIVAPDGIVTAKGTLGQIVADAFAKVYPHPIPFMFEGFRAKSLTQARKNFSYIARSLCSDLVNYQWFHAQTSQVRNRMSALLSHGRAGAWGILDNHCNVIPPTSPALVTVFEELDSLLETNAEKGLALGKAFERLTAPPYGANDYSAALLLAAYLASRKASTRLSVDGERNRLDTWAEKAFPDRGVDIKVLKATTIHQVDLEGTRNAVLELCRAIETNTSLEKWKELRVRIDTLTQQEDVPKELADKVVACRMMARHGEEVWTKYDQFVKEQLSHLTRAKKDGDVARALETLRRCDKQLDEGRALERYAYGPREQHMLKQMMDRADDIIHENFDQWLKTLRCDSYAQWGSFSTSVENQIRTFRQLGYEDLARRLKTRLDQLGDNMEELKKLQTVRETTDGFIQTCKPTRYTSYEQLMAWEQEGTQLVNYIQKSLPTVTAGRLTDEVLARLREVKRHLQSYRDEIAGIIDAALELKDRRDCYSLLDRVRSMLERSIRPQDADDLREIADCTANLLRDMEVLDRVKDDPDATVRQLEALRAKWENVDLISAQPVLDNVLAERQREWMSLEQEWYDQFLSMPLSEISGWTAEQCTRWTKAAEARPPYLGEKSNQRLAEVSRAVQQRLNEIPVMAAVEAYSRLTDEQKKQFWKIVGQTPVGYGA